jgi:hypothetical protein
VLNLIESAREKSKTEGKYAEAIKEYENILAYSVRLSSSPNIEEKLGKEKLCTFIERNNASK